PYVGVASPDLPWRFTPVGATSADLPDPAGGPARTQRRVQPWLALVVVPADLATLAPAAPGGVATLRCPAGELPDPAEAWAWAHVQITHQATEPLADVAAVPGRATARLLCPRRLTGGQRYLACLVPTFAAGRAALVGGP